MSKPTQQHINYQIAKLRVFIEDDDSDPLERRIAQAVEDALRWSREDTDWNEPIEELSTIANIIRNDVIKSKLSVKEWANTTHSEYNQVSPE